MATNILLIHDDTHRRIFLDLARLFTQAGHRVSLSIYGQEAFRALRSGNFPLVITCLNQDWSDKRPFMEAVSDSGRRISVFFLKLDPETGTPYWAYQLTTDGRHFTSQAWGGLRHLVTSCLRQERATPGLENWQAAARPTLQKTRREHAPWWN